LRSVGLQFADGKLPFVNFLLPCCNKKILFLMAAAKWVCGGDCF